MAEFEDILGRIVTSEEDRTTLHNLAGRYPALRDSVMAQDEFSRRMDTHRADLEELGKWRNWKSQAWDPDKQATKKELLLNDQLADAERRNVELQAMQGGNVNFEEVVDGLKKNGFMTQADFDQKYRPSFVDKKTFEEGVTARLNQQANVFENVFFTTLPLMQQHQQDFGEILDARQLAEFAVKNGINDMGAAYKKMFEPRLNELSAQRETTRLDKIRLEEREKVRQEMAMQPNAQGNPTDNSGGSRVMGHLQARKMAGTGKPGERPELDKVELGSNVIASVAAEDLRKDPAAFLKTA